MLNCYLCGPITGLTYEEATGWRNKVKGYFNMKDYPVRFFDPMDGKDHFMPADLVVPENYPPEDFIFTKPDAIFRRDLHCIDCCNVVLVNFKDIAKNSRGTMFELGYAYANDVLIVAVGDPDEIAHPFVMMSSIVFPVAGQLIAVKP